MPLRMPSHRGPLLIGPSRFLPRHRQIRKSPSRSTSLSPDRAAAGSITVDVFFLSTYGGSYWLLLFGRDLADDMTI